MEIVSPNYDHIILTDEEIKIWTEWALRIARKKKDALLNEINYAAKLRAEKGYNIFDYDKLSEYVRSKAAKQNLVIDEHNEEIFEILCMYYSNDPSFELDGHGSFMKGIMLRGNVGCGKTTLLSLFQDNSFRPFTISSCRTVSNSFTKDGIDALNEFSSMRECYPQTNNGHTSAGICFDDLGTEDDKKNFGNAMNVMLEVMQNIYDKKIYSNFSLTTNLGGDEIESYYGKRLRSRLREMFNVFDFMPDAPDRRK